MNQELEARETADVIKRMIFDPSKGERPGLVAEVDVKNHLVKVNVMPEEDLTDWLEWEGLGMGMGAWVGVWMPAIGAYVVLSPTTPDSATYRVRSAMFNGADPPPAYTAGQWLLQHAETGNQLLLDTDGHVYLGLKDGAHPIVLQPFITEHFNTLVDAVNALQANYQALKLLLIAAGGSVVPPGILPYTAGPVSDWSSGDVTTKVSAL